WDPASDPDQAEHRFERTLRFMVEADFLTQAEADAAEFPEVADPSSTNDLQGPNGHLLEMVRTELLANGFTEEQLDGGGMQITTTIDEDLQDAAIAAAQDLPEAAPQAPGVAASS